MKQDDNDSFASDLLKAQILQLCEPHEPYITMSTLTMVMATIMACAGPEERDPAVLKVAKDTLKHALGSIRAKLNARNFKMTEH
jgi:hypothetical protein